MIKRGSEQFSGYNKPKRTPSHPTKSHVVVAKVGTQVKTIRFGQQGVSIVETVFNGAIQAKKTYIAVEELSTDMWTCKINTGEIMKLSMGQGFTQLVE